MTAATSVPVATTTSSVLVRPENKTRRYLILQNDGAVEIYLQLGKPAVLNEGIRINPAGGSYEMIKGQNLFTGEIYAISSAASSLLVTELGEND